MKADKELLKKGKKIGKTIFALSLCVMLCMNLSGCTTELEDNGISYIDANTDVSKLSASTIDVIVKNVVKSMSLNEKVGQMFIVELSSLEPDRSSVTSKKLTPKMKKGLRLYPVGGVVLFSRDIKTRKQTKRLIDNLQDKSKASLFVCVDEEGGQVSRIASNSKMKTTLFEPMYQIGLTHNVQKAFTVGKTIGSDLKRLGFNVNFAPVADVLKKETDAQFLASDEIGERSFGSDAKLVSDMVEMEVKGLKKQGICATLKHFPGQGSSDADTHLGATNIEKTIEQLRTTEFLPFQAGIDAGAEFVMLSHESVNTVTGENVPASMSSLMIHDILRDELGFKGLVITDALNMKAITQQYSAKKAAVSCVKAGADVLLMPDDLEEAYNGIMAAVKSGKISEKRINRSVERIIKCKIKNKILPLTSQLVVSASQSSYEDYQNIGEWEH